MKRLTLTSEDGRKMDARLIRTFARSEFADARPTAALTVHNLALGVFEATEATQIIYLVTRTVVPLFLLEINGHWYDVKANRVEVTQS